MNDRKNELLHELDALLSAALGVHGNPGETGFDVASAAGLLRPILSESGGTDAEHDTGPGMTGETERRKSALGGSLTSLSGILGAVQSAAGANGISNWISMVNPIAAGLMNLFDSNEPAQDAVMPPFELPTPIHESWGYRNDTPKVLESFDRGQYGEAREVGVSPPQIVVQVQAMDASSFLDRSNDIAMAVRRALLESNSLSDVMRDL